MTPLTHIDLCSGIGGAAIAAEAAGFQPIGFCEIKPECRNVLETHFPNSIILENIYETQASDFDPALTGRRPDLLTAGFPCQPFSLSGKRRGKEDDRNLWPEVARLITEIRPAWFVGENVDGFINMGLDRSISDLEEAGYACRTFSIPASAIGACHERQRCFLVAHDTGIDRLETDESLSFGTQKALTDFSDSMADEIRRIGGGILSAVERAMGFPSRYVLAEPSPANANCEPKLEMYSSDGANGAEWFSRYGSGRFDRVVIPGSMWNVSPSELCFMDDGISRRVVRSMMEALGNAIVPAQIYPILKGIADIETEVL